MQNSLAVLRHSANDDIDEYLVKEIGKETVCLAAVKSVLIHSIIREIEHGRFDLAETDMGVLKDQIGILERMNEFSAARASGTRVSTARGRRSVQADEALIKRYLHLPMQRLGSAVQRCVHKILHDENPDRLRQRCYMLLDNCIFRFRYLSLQRKCFQPWQKLAARNPMRSLEDRSRKEMIMHLEKELEVQKRNSVSQLRDRENAQKNMELELENTLTAFEVVRKEHNELKEKYDRLLNSTKADRNRYQEKAKQEVKDEWRKIERATRDLEMKVTLGRRQERDRKAELAWKVLSRVNRNENESYMAVFQSLFSVSRILFQTDSRSVFSGLADDFDRGDFLSSSLTNSNRVMRENVNLVSPELLERSFKHQKPDPNTNRAGSTMAVAFLVFFRWKTLWLDRRADSQKRDTEEKYAERLKALETKFKDDLIKLEQRYEEESIRNSTIYNKRTHLSRDKLVGWFSSSFRGSCRSNSPRKKVEFENSHNDPSARLRSVFLSWRIQSLTKEREWEERLCYNWEDKFRSLEMLRKTFRGWQGRCLVADNAVKYAKCMEFRMQKLIDALEDPPCLKKHDAHFFNTSATCSNTLSTYSKVLRADMGDTGGYFGTKRSCFFHYGENGASPSRSRLLDDEKEAILAAGARYSGHKVPQTLKRAPSSPQKKSSRRHFSQPSSPSSSVKTTSPILVESDRPKIHPASSSRIVGERAQSAKHLPKEQGRRLDTAQVRRLERESGKPHQVANPARITHPVWTARGVNVSSPVTPKVMSKSSSLLVSPQRSQPASSGAKRIQSVGTIRAIGSGMKRDSDTPKKSRPGSAAPAAKRGATSGSYNVVKNFALAGSATDRLKLGNTRADREKLSSSSQSATHAQAKSSSRGKSKQADEKRESSKEWTYDVPLKDWTSGQMTKHDLVLVDVGFGNSRESDLRQTHQEYQDDDYLGRSSQASERRVSTYIDPSGSGSLRSSIGASPRTKTSHKALKKQHTSELQDPRDALKDQKRTFMFYPEGRDSGSSARSSSGYGRSYMSAQGGSTAARSSLAQMGMLRPSNRIPKKLAASPSPLRASAATSRGSPSPTRNSNCTPKNGRSLWSVMGVHNEIAFSPSGQNMGTNRTMPKTECSSRTVRLSNHRSAAKTDEPFSVILTMVKSCRNIFFVAWRDRTKCRATFVNRSLLRVRQMELQRFMLLWRDMVGNIQRDRARQYLQFRSRSLVFSHLTRMSQVIKLAVVRCWKLHVQKQNSVHMLLQSHDHKLVGKFFLKWRFYRDAREKHALFETKMVCNSSTGQEAVKRLTRRINGYHVKALFGFWKLLKDVGLAKRRFHVRRNFLLIKWARAHESLRTQGIFLRWQQQLASERISKHLEEKHSAAHSELKAQHSAEMEQKEMALRKSGIETTTSLSKFFLSEKRALEVENLEQRNDKLGTLERKMRTFMYWRLHITNEQGIRRVQHAVSVFCRGTTARIRELDQAGVEKCFAMWKKAVVEDRKVIEMREKIQDIQKTMQAEMDAKLEASQEQNRARILTYVGGGLTQRDDEAWKKHVFQLWKIYISMVKREKEMHANLRQVQQHLGQLKERTKNNLLEVMRSGSIKTFFDQWKAAVKEAQQKQRELLERSKMAGRVMFYASGEKAKITFIAWRGRTRKITAGYKKVEDVMVPRDIRRTLQTAIHGWIYTVESGQRIKFGLRMLSGQKGTVFLKEMFHRWVFFVITKQRRYKSLCFQQWRESTKEIQDQTHKFNFMLGAFSSDLTKVAFYGWRTWIQEKAKAAKDELIEKKSQAYNDILTKYGLLFDSDSEEKILRSVLLQWRVVVVEYRLAARTKEFYKNMDRQKLNAVMVMFKNNDTNLKGIVFNEWVLQKRLADQYKFWLPKLTGGDDRFSTFQYFSKWAALTAESKRVKKERMTFDRLSETRKTVLSGMSDKLSFRFCMEKHFVLWRNLALYKKGGRKRSDALMTRNERVHILKSAFLRWALVPFQRVPILNIIEKTHIKHLNFRQLYHVRYCLYFWRTVVHARRATNRMVWARMYMIRNVFPIVDRKILVRVFYGWRWRMHILKMTRLRRSFQDERVRLACAVGVDISSRKAKVKKWLAFHIHEQGRAKMRLYFYIWSGHCYLEKGIPYPYGGQRPYGLIREQLAASAQSPISLARRESPIPIPEDDVGASTAGASSVGMGSVKASLKEERDSVAKKASFASEIQGSQNAKLSGSASFPKKSPAASPSVTSKASSGKEIRQAEQSAREGEQSVTIFDASNVEANTVEVGLDSVKSQPLADITTSQAIASTDRRSSEATIMVSPLVASQANAQFANKDENTAEKTSSPKGSSMDAVKRGSIDATKRGSTDATRGSTASPNRAFNAIAPSELSEPQNVHYLVSGHMARQRNSSFWQPTFPGLHSKRELKCGNVTKMLVDGSTARSRIGAQKYYKDSLLYREERDFSKHAETLAIGEAHVWLIVQRCLELNWSGGGLSLEFCRQKLLENFPFRASPLQSTTRNKNKKALSPNSSYYSSANKENNSPTVYSRSLKSGYRSGLSPKSNFSNEAMEQLLSLDAMTRDVDYLLHYFRSIPVESLELAACKNPSFLLYYLESFMKEFSEYLPVPVDQSAWKIHKRSPILKPSYIVDDGIQFQYESQPVLESSSLRHGLALFKEVTRGEEFAYCILNFDHLVRIRCIRLGPLVDEMNDPRFAQPFDKIGIDYMEPVTRKWVRGVESVTITSASIENFFLGQPIVTRYLKLYRRDKLCIGHMSFS